MSGIAAGLANFGRFEASAQFLVATVVAMCCCLSGVMSLKNSSSSKSSSLFFFVSGICIFLIGFAFYYIAQSSQAGATVLGGVGAYNIARNVI